MAENIWNEVLFRNVDVGTLEAIRHALAQGAEVDHRGGLCLRTACVAGRHDVAELLLAHGAQVHGEYGRSLELAAKHGHASIVRLLIDAGADPHQFDESALRFAVDYSRVQAASVLAECNPDWSTKNDYLLMGAWHLAQHGISRNDDACEVLALLVGKTGHLTGTMYDVARRFFQADAGEMAKTSFPTQKKLLLDGDGKATSRLRQLARAGMLPVLFAPESNPDPVQARRLYRTVENALPSELKQTAWAVDMTPFMNVVTGSAMKLRGAMPLLNNGGHSR